MTAGFLRRSGSHWKGHRLVRITAQTEEGTAAGINGLIVSAAVMASAHVKTAVALDVTVLVTLVVYWSAERYALLVADRAHSSRRPRWGEVRGRLTSGWEMVTTSVVPLVVLILARALGGTLNEAVIWALTVCTLLLFITGWEIGRDSQLGGRERLLYAVVAAAFGAAMILLKAYLH